MLDRGPSITRQNGNARLLRRNTCLPWHFNDASIRAYGHLWITGEFMNRLLIVAILIISTLPLYAQGQAPNAAKLKADTQMVASIIKGDKAKTQTYCQIANLANQIAKAIQEKDTKKAEELAQKLNEMEKNLGPEYLALVDDLRTMDLTSKDGQEIVSIFDGLDESCPH
jgi:hypothetical protein